ncbi:MAG: hypothetical protein J07HQX50_01581 [Haloquadratum sp. J07HQX50]|nr:MAG: hypothetical protein J07HQX50_01581 [Haloquadratum sp. J07HQX50]
MLSLNHSRRVSRYEMLDVAHLQRHRQLQANKQRWEHGVWNSRGPTSKPPQVFHRALILSHLLAHLHRELPRAVGTYSVLAEFLDILACKVSECVLWIDPGALGCNDLTCCFIITVLYRANHSDHNRR